MPERDYGLGGREAREAYDSAKAYAESQAAAGRDDPPPTRPRARPESNDKSESPTISIVDADTDETVANWDVGSGDVTFSGDSSLSETTQRRKKSKSGLSISEPKINIGPLEIKEKDAKLDVSMDWSNVFDNLLKDAMPKGVNLNRFKTSWDGETIKLLDVGMSFAEGGKVSDEAQLEMDLIMNEQVDPVSGNTAPVGAKPEEVRDDVEIRVSPGEYVINAQTVRYFGEDFFDELQKAAAQGFERIKEGEELPFRDDELDIEDDEIEEVEPEGFAYGGRVKGYAEGDMVVPQPVGGGYGQYGGTGAIFTGFELRTFTDPSNPKRKIKIAFFNGRPITRIPETYVEESAEPAEVAAQQTALIRDTKDRRELGYELKTTYNEKDVKEWSDYDYGQYYKDTIDLVESGKSITSLSLPEKAIVGVVGSGLTGNILGGIGLSRLAEKSKYDRAVKIFNQTQGLINKGEFSDPIFEKTIKYTNYIIGKQLGFLDEDAVEPEKPDVSLLGRYAGKDKPKSGLDFNPSTSVFKTQYDRDEALSGTFGSRAAYLASQEIHSQGLRAKGLPDTSYFGTNQDLVTTVKNLATYGTVHTPEQAAAVSTPAPAPEPVVKKDDGKKAFKEKHKAFVDSQGKSVTSPQPKNTSPSVNPKGNLNIGKEQKKSVNVGGPGFRAKGGLIERPNR
jgi:hypothetical protein